MPKKKLAKQHLRYPHRLFNKLLKLQNFHFYHTHRPHPHTNTHNHHLTLFTFPPMPPKANKNWGQSDKDLFVDLVNRQLIDITDTTLPNMDHQVSQAHFWHHDLRNFRRNYLISCPLGTWKLSTAARDASEEEVRCCVFYCFFCNTKRCI